MDETTPTEKDPLRQAEEQFARAERSVADATERVVEHEQRMSDVLSATRQKAVEADFAISDYLSAAVASGIAEEAHKSRSFDCETAKHALERAKKLKQDISKQRNELESKHEELRESYTSSQEDTRVVESRLMNQEIDWIGAKTDYYSACLQTRIAADHLKICEEALLQAHERLNAAESETADAQSRLNDIESSMDKLLDEVNRTSGVSHN